MENKHNKIIAITSIVIAILVLVLGVTYAFVIFNREGSKFSTLVTGDIYMHYNESNNINLANVVPRNDYDPSSYFEFTIKGKNTNTIHDIIYDIQITDGNDHDTRTIRLDPKFLKFKLVEVNDDTETLIVNNKYYNNLYQDRIWVDKIVKNTTVETTKTYRLYVWISDEIKLGNTGDADYDLDTWNNDIYASIKVTVTGDFNEKSLGNPDYIRTTGWSTENDNYLNSNLVKKTIEKIVFMNTNEVPGDAIGSFDVSEKQNGSIMGWYYDSDTNGNYELYIGEDGGVYANPNSSYLFYNLTALKEIDLTYFHMTSDVTNISSMFANTNNLTNIGDISNWDVSNVTDMSYLFQSAKKLENIDLNNWNTLKVSNMQSMFSGAESLINLNISNWNTSKVQKMNYMFSGASNLVNVDLSNWNTANVTDMDRIFYEVSSLENLDLSNWNTSKVKEMGYMFYGARSLKSLDLSRWDTTSVENMDSMFFNTSQLSSVGDISNWKTSNVMNMTGMFNRASRIESLDLSGWNTSSVKNMSAMFMNTSQLSSIGDISNWDTSNVTSMYNLFRDASNLTTLNLSKWNTSKVTHIFGMFQGTSSLISIDISSATFASVTDFSNLFYNTSSSLTVTVKDQVAYDFISPLLSTEQRGLLTIKS